MIKSFTRPNKPVVAKINLCEMQMLLAQQYG